MFWIKFSVPILRNNRYFIVCIGFRLYRINFAVGRDPIYPRSTVFGFVLAGQRNSLYGSRASTVAAPWLWNVIHKAVDTKRTLESFGIAQIIIETAQKNRKEDAEQGG